MSISTELHPRPLPPSYNTPSSGGGGGGGNSQHQYHNLPIANVGRSHSPGPASRSVSGTMFSYHNPTLAASPYSTLPRRLHQPSSVISWNTESLLLSANVGLFTVYITRFNSLKSYFLHIFVLLQQQQRPRPPSSSSSTVATSTFKSGGSVKPMPPLRITAKTPLLEDDRESCV